MHYSHKQSARYESNAWEPLDNNILKEYFESMGPSDMDDQGSNNALLKRYNFQSHIIIKEILGMHVTF